MSGHAVDVKEAQGCLEELISQAARGEEVILTEQGQPVAKIISVRRPTAQRRFGSAKGLIFVREGFDEPLGDFRTYM